MSICVDHVEMFGGYGDPSLCLSVPDDPLLACPSCGDPGYADINGHRYCGKADCPDMRCLGRDV